MKALTLAFLYAMNTWFSADVPQCTRMSSIPAAPLQFQSFRLFKNFWVLNESRHTFLSSDQGNSWQEVLNSPSPPNRIRTLVGPFDGKLFAVFLDGPEIMYLDQGTQWHPIQTPITPGWFAAVGVVAISLLVVC